MMPAWFYLLTFYITAFPEHAAIAEERTKFACEIIMNDECFFDQDQLCALPVVRLKRAYEFAFLGAKLAAWQSLFIDSDWSEFLFKEIYRTNGVCDRSNEWVQAQLKTARRIP
ncbi:MAG: hypothetical protein PHQ23_17585 [Candidatus Wallbacteria bacterium]|nr:hypothetical protein [Candidatus Wallbacteria bacterium]